MRAAVRGKTASAGNERRRFAHTSRTQCSGCGTYVEHVESSVAVRVHRCTHRAAARSQRITPVRGERMRGAWALVWGR